MPTFQELQKQVVDAQNRKEVLAHIVEYLEENFRSNGKPAIKRLLKEDKTIVPESTIEDVVQDLMSEVKVLDVEMSKILASTVSVDAVDATQEPKKGKVKN